MKIPRMLIDYAVLFTVPSALCYFLLADHKQETAEMLDKRPDVQRLKKQQADIVKLIKDSADNKTETNEKIEGLMKKGSLD